MKKFSAAILPVFSVFVTIFYAAADDAIAPRPAIAPNVRAPSMVANISAQQKVPGAVSASAAITAPKAMAPASTLEKEPVEETKPVVIENCRDAFRNCMDDFCLRDATEGERCACSSIIDRSKPILREISEVQSEAERIFSEDVEYEEQGIQAVKVFQDREPRGKKPRIDFREWAKTGRMANNAESLDEDFEIGDTLYAMAFDACKNRLDACPKDAKMEETLYSRLITNDCKAFNVFLEDQKKIAQQNVKTAEKAVRAARFKKLGETNKYLYPGDCLLAFKSCVSEKGGCGQNFEHCWAGSDSDISLLKSRATACENILDQCRSSRTETVRLWNEEMPRIMKNAGKYVDKNQRNTCFARSRACLEENCSVSYNISNLVGKAGCLTDIKVARGICPVITECITLLNKDGSGAGSSFENVIKGELGELRIAVCKNDIAKCFEENCGADFTKEKCVGQRLSKIQSFCPKENYQSCADYDQDKFETIISAALLGIDHQMYVGCVNRLSVRLGEICGLDMECLPAFTKIASAKSISELEKLNVSQSRNKPTPMRQFVQDEVDSFFKRLQKDKEMIACKESPSAGNAIFETAKLLVTVQAEQRVEREFMGRVSELSLEMELDDAEEMCKKLGEDRKTALNAMNKPMQRRGEFGKLEATPEEEQSGSWIVGEAFYNRELRVCEIQRVQRVCARGGESKGTALAKGYAGGTVQGTSAGMMAPPWGPLIGAVAGGAMGALSGMAAGGRETNCDMITVTEKIPMGRGGRRSDGSSTGTSTRSSSSGTRT